MDGSEEARRQEVLRRRLVDMGLDVQVLPGGRALVATLPLRPEPFETPSGGARRFASVTFVTLGDDRIKCLRPRPLFHLPFVRAIDCASAEQIESRIRSAWGQRLETLKRSRRWLEKLGAPAPGPDDAPVLTLALGGEETPAPVSVVEPGRVTLQSVGPLAGVTLRRAEDRTHVVDPSIASAVDLELAVSTRMEELARLDSRLAREERLQRPPTLERAPALPTPALERRYRLLVVGPQLALDRALAEALRGRGYDVAPARTAQEAMRSFELLSPELVLSEIHIGRFEGIELIPALRAVPGIEEVPVVLVDDRLRAERREAARQAGASGYLVRPLDVRKIANGFDQLVRRPRRRRFTRYGQRLAVHRPEGSAPWVTADVGRGGMFLWTEGGATMDPVERFRIALPLAGEAIDVEAEIVHRRSVPGTVRQGAGLRFRRFARDAESRWIAFLRSLDPQAAPAA